MARRSRNGLTRNQNRVLRAAANGATLRIDPKHPQLVFVNAKSKQFRTQRVVVRGLVEDGMLLMLGDEADVEVTQKGLSVLDRMGKNIAKSKLPATLHPTVRPLVLQRLAELRMIGFEDPVDALLALAFETDEEGEFTEPVQVRIECLKAAAPFVRPKLAAVVQRNVGDGQSHAEWLEELKGYVEQEERGGDGDEGPV